MLKILKLNFWKTKNGAEVDVLISRGQKILLAVELKASPFPRSRDLTGLTSFKEDHPKVPVLMCAPVDRARLIEKNIRLVPPQELLRLIKNL